MKVRNTGRYSWYAETENQWAGGKESHLNIMGCIDVFSTSLEIGKDGSFCWDLTILGLGVQIRSWVTGDEAGRCDGKSQCANWECAKCGNKEFGEAIGARPIETETVRMLQGEREV